MPSQRQVLSDKLAYGPAHGLAVRVRRRDLSPVEVVEAFIRHIEARNPSLNAFVYLDFDGARAKAKEAERAVMAGEQLGPLHGVPTALKDLFDFKPGWTATLGGLCALSRRLVAVFAADVEGYSRLMGADEVGTLKGLTERRAILDGLIGERRGRIANAAGDSVLAEFGSAVYAVQCAVDAQAALAEVNSTLPPDRRISFRIGVHIGDVMARAGDLFGDGVNIAARLQTLATPGAVCISAATYDQVRKVLPMTFVDLGAQQVKNIQEPIRVYQVGTTSETREAALARVAEVERPRPLPDKPSIAGGKCAVVKLNEH